jgi:hypothetical protein
MNTTRTHSLAALGAAAFLTLAMLLGVNTLATVDSVAPQMAQADTTRA